MCHTCDNTLNRRLECSFEKINSPLASVWETTSPKTLIFFLRHASNTEEIRRRKHIRADLKRNAQSIEQRRFQTKFMRAGVLVQAIRNLLECTL